MALNTKVAEMSLYEMANKWKNVTGFPMNIRIDENQSYLQGGHSKRIKFQLDGREKMNIHNSAQSLLLKATKVATSLSKVCEASDFTFLFFYLYRYG